MEREDVVVPEEGLLEEGRAVGASRALPVSPGHGPETGQGETGLAWAGHTATVSQQPQTGLAQAGHRRSFWQPQRPPQHPVSWSWLQEGDSGAEVVSSSLGAARLMGEQSRAWHQAGARACLWAVGVRALCQGELSLSLLPV